ncbi:MAG: sugar porter family MFS transporter [Bacteroidota bacterium]
MNNKLIYWSITVALAGFLFGFDTIVISGAEQSIQELWGADYPCLGFLDFLFPFATGCADAFHAFFIMSMALWGTLIGALFGGIPCNILGRKVTLFWIGVLYFISAVGSGLASDPYMFSIFRFIGGLGVGASSVAAPIYISEIAPPEKRGRLVAIYQFNLVFGILIAFFSNYFIGQYLGENAWRWMLGIEAVPAAIYTLMVLGVPQSPRWLILKKNAVEKASHLLQQLNPKQAIEEQVSAIKASVTSSSTSSKGFFSGKYSKPITLAFLVAFFNQVSGINFVLYYSKRIFNNAGIEDALLASIPIGIINLIFTFVGLYLIDRLGRKQLLFIGSIGYILTLLGVAYAYNTSATLLVICVCAFVGAHAIGQGAIIWVFISEIFPNKVRDYGMSLGSGTHWLFAALITMVTLPIFKALEGQEHWIFIFFAAMMFLQLLFVLFMMPETKGVPLEELEKRLVKSDKEG